MHHMLRLSLASILLSAGTAAALANDDLKGPKVPDRHVPGVESGLGTMQGGEKRDVAREMPIPHVAFMRMLSDALGDSAPEQIRVTAEQRAAIEKISSEFTAKQRTYMAQHKADIDALVAKHGPEVRQLATRLGAPGAAQDGKARRPDAGSKEDRKRSEGEGEMEGQMRQGLSDDARAEVIAKLKELQAGAPRQEDARTAVWGLLKPDQQAAVQKRVDAFKAEQEKKMDERYKEREKKRLEERGTGKNAPAGTPPTGKGEDASSAKKLSPQQREELINQMPADLRERFTKLPAEVQDRMLTRLNGASDQDRQAAYDRMRERIKEQGGQRGNDKGKGRNPGSESKKD